MNKQSYAERLNQSSENKLSEEIQHKVTEASLQVQQDILATSRQLSTAKRELETAKSASPFNSQNVINAELVVEGYQDGLIRLNKLYAELFGSVEANSPVTAKKPSKAKAAAVSEGE